MKYHEVAERVRKVICSCKTIDQLKVAARYSVILICDKFKRNNGEPFSVYLSNRIKEKEMISWTKTLIKDQKDIINC